MLEDFNLTSLGHRPSTPESSSRYYTLSQLNSGTGYIVCFETLSDPSEDNVGDDHSKANHQITNEKELGKNTCWEMSTLEEELGFPVTEVASAAAVSTTTTAFVVVLVCCCCFPGKDNNTTASSLRTVKPPSYFTLHFLDFPFNLMFSMT